jgi:tetratricopeptide (TPR) repeat protein
MKLQVYGKVAKEELKVFLCLHRALLRDLDDLNSAHAAFERTIQILEAHFATSHPNTASCYMNLGSVLRAQGKKEQARACYQRALAIFEQFLPPGHPNIETAKKWLKSLDDLP